MRGFALTEANSASYGRDSPSVATPRASFGESATRRSASIRCDWRRKRSASSDPILLPAKHFLQEDHPTAVAQAIADLAAPLG